MSHFDTYQELLTSLHSTTGSEYDIKEVADSASDLIFRDMIKVTKRYCYGNIRQIITLSLEEKLRIAEVIRLHTSSQIWQIEKFLHMKTSYCTTVQKNASCYKSAKYAIQGGSF